MTPDEMAYEIEYLANLAESLSCHLALFENMYGNLKAGPERAVEDSDTFFRSLSDIVDKAETVSARLNHAVQSMYEGMKKKRTD